MTVQQATTEMGTFYFLAEDACIASVLGCGRAWEPEVLDAVRPLLPAEGPCHIVDVGAHIGTHTIPYAHWVRGRGRVLAFEPQAVMADLLRRNVDANGCGGEVAIFPFAVGHVDGVEVSLEDVIHDGPGAGQRYAYEDGRPFNYGGVQLGVGARKVVMRTLDSFAFTHVGLLKVDVEGAEPLVLWGARELIRRNRPILLFERNAKAITASMQLVADIPEEVLEFQIESFAAGLGYSEPLWLGSDQLLLLPPSARAGGRAGPVSSRAGGAK